MSDVKFTFSPEFDQTITLQLDGFIALKGLGELFAEGLTVSELRDSVDAMGAGVCVLASDVPENCEVIEDTGFVFKRGDVHDLQRMLSLLLSGTAARNRGRKRPATGSPALPVGKGGEGNSGGLRGLDVAGNDAKAIRREFYTVTGSNLAVKWRKNGASWVR